ncbi:MAG: phosphomannomutase, partial [Candidatus Heimdallarchaeota archaeon]
MAASHDHIFRAYDVRGIFNKDLDVSIMQKIGIAFGTYMKQKNGITITLGGDIRASTNILQHA